MIRFGLVLIMGISIALFAGCKADDDDDSSDSTDPTTPTTTLSWTLAASDDFERADNTFTTADKDIMLGADWDTWADEDEDPNSMIEITNGQVEIRGDSGGDYEKTALNATIAKIYIKLTTGDVASLDTSGADYANGFGLSGHEGDQSGDGCPYAGGVSLFNGVYNTYIYEFSETWELRKSEEVQVMPNTTYQMELIIDEGEVTFSLKNDAGTAISTLTYSGSSCTFLYPQFSFNYIEDVSFFYDNFKAYTGVYE